MQNPIQRAPLFVTPESAQELFVWAESMENKLEAYEMIMFTMNYCHSLVEKEMNKVECVFGHANCTICV